MPGPRVPVHPSQTTTVVTRVPDRMDYRSRDRFEVVSETIVDVGFVGFFSIYDDCDVYRFL